MKIKNLFKGEGFVNFSSSILAIVCGLLFGLIILLISNPSQAFGGFMMIIQGGFTDGMQGFGQVLYMATPLIMTGLSVGFAFKTGLFNIGASGGGTDIVGVYAALHWKSFSVGKLQLLFNALVYCLCAFLFDLPIAIYSIIYAAVYSFVLDKVHLQNIEMSLMIFTKNPEIKSRILKDFVRGVTYWKGLGAYTQTETEVLVTIVSKDEVNDLRRMITQMDPKAFIIVNEGLQITGNFIKRLVE